MFDISGKALNFGANILEENNYFGLSFWETAPGQCQALRKFEIFVLIIQCYKFCKNLA